MTEVYREPYLQVKYNGTILTDALSARVRHGYNMAVAQVDVTCQTLLAGAEPWGTVTVVVGSSQATAGTRFVGHFMQPSQQLYPQTVTLHCKGKLVRAEIYNAYNGVDMTSYAVTPEDYGHTDQTMVSTVLYICGVWPTPISGETPADGIDGTGRMLGLTGKSKSFKWSSGQSGLSFIQELDKVTGYRTFDTFGGSVVRRQISAIPGTVADYTFTEGVDIIRGAADKTLDSLRNLIVVNGWDGDGTTRAGTAQAVSSWLPIMNTLGGTEAWYLPMNYSSPMIEAGTTIGGTVGISAKEVANQLLTENNMLRATVPFVTQRDDMIEPGDTISVTSTRMGVSQNFWVQAVEVQSFPFTQTLTCVAPVTPP